MPKTLQSNAYKVDSTVQVADTYNMPGTITATAAPGLTVTKIWELLSILPSASHFGGNHPNVLTLVVNALVNAEVAVYLGDTFFGVVDETTPATDVIGTSLTGGTWCDGSPVFLSIEGKNWLRMDFTSADTGDDVNYAILW